MSLACESPVFSNMVSWVNHMVPLQGGKHSSQSLLFVCKDEGDSGCSISSLSITYHIMKLSYGKEIRGFLW